MPNAPYDVVKSVSIISISKTTWTPFISTPVFSLKKRQVYGTSAPVSIEELMAMCPLNNVQNADVPAGCIAGIYNKFCYNPYDPPLLAQCQDAYNRAFGASIFKSLGDVCPAWRQGPRSAACSRAISTFSYNLFVGADPNTGNPIYIRLGSSHASQMVSNILANPKFAPCPSAAPKCNWT
jgi:hypothetical protein